ncbi:DUF4113 domain-containing protein [Xanthocytophaga agilis]|uniref:DUF4113 domain-containing protein n=1 Tax=Xanthocytophaga agilis TaxID=3048010 RepID=A0AAE3R6R4_9BACT|nr:DUF4113 domain-containing protein [Xanthocytophaga agilis]MDJ1501697.1 DUF4113 domain-containing protein [Xanthocytophaga agilis]
MAVIDKINACWGAGIVFLASNGTAQAWQMPSMMHKNHTKSLYEGHRKEDRIRMNKI